MEDIWEDGDRAHYKILKKYDVWVSPLDVDQKELITELMLESQMGKPISGIKAVYLGIRIGLKCIKGVKRKNEAGSLVDYELKFEDGKLTKKSLSVLLNHEVSNHLSDLISHLMNSVPTEFKDANGKPSKFIKFVGKNTHLGKN